ncbi:COG4223 family protein [Methylocystis parvus]|uniref:COG4223 family protein n=1 Tax=Methylocystis parvus TaxID=134 RepID=UPI003C76B0DA
MAAPETEKTVEASKAESPAPAGAAAPPPRPAGPPKKRKGGLIGKLFLSVAALAILAGAAGYAALTFRDKDPRIGLAADYVDQGLAEAQGALDKAQGLLADVTGSPKPAQKAGNPHDLIDKAPLAPAPEETPAAPPQAAAPVETAKEPETPPAEKPVAPSPETKQADVPEPPRKPVELAQEPAPIPAPIPAPVPAPVEPTPAPAAKASPPAADADGFTDRDLISALEGRLDALSDEVQTLRGKVDAPKSEARAAPETEVSKAEAEKPAPAPAAAPDTTSAAVVVAFALQRDLESGRPFTEEIAALSRLNAEPAPAPVLIELSEKGAATGAQLHDAFLPIARKLKSHETHADAPHEGGDIAGHLLEGASKLVKVRPVGQAAPDSLGGKLERIEAALVRNDFAGAEQIFDSLPDEAKNEAKEFGETLRQRAEAAKAADALLHGAIAALGKK